MIQELNVTIDLKKLESLFFDAWTHQAWSTSYPTVQSGISVSNREPNDYLASCGGGFSLEQEKKFSQFHSFYENSYITQVDRQLDFSVYRWRWMILFGKGCYSFHQDWSKRVHIPIFTTPQSFFIFRDPVYLHHLQVGKVYIIDTSQTHSAMNGTNDWRVHLVGCIAPSS